MSLSHDETRRGDLDRLLALVAVQNAIALAAPGDAPDWNALLDHLEQLTDAGGVLLALSSEGSLRLHAGTGTAGNQVGRDVPRTSTLAGRAAAEGVTLVRSDLAADAALDAGWYARLGARRAMAAPVFAGSHAAGALEAVAGEGLWRDRDVHTLQMLAGLAGAALTRSTDTGAGRAVPPLELVQYGALHDPDTDLPNRALFFDRLTQGIQLARREDAPLAVLLLAVDGLGEDAGALRVLAGHLLDALRASDTVARLGVDQFALLLPGANAIGALGAARKLLRATQGITGTGGRPVSARAGIAIFPEHGTEANILLEQAHAALAAAASGPDSAVIYQGE